MNTITLPTTSQNGAMRFGACLPLMACTFLLLSPARAEISIVCSPDSGPARVGVAYSTTCTASGGAGPYSFGLNPPNGVPAGLNGYQSASNAATLTGIPTKAGEYSFGVFAQDSSKPPQMVTYTFNGSIEHYQPLPSQNYGNGLKGYISMNVPTPPNGYGYGVSLYSAAWPLLAKPLAGFQIGLASTWIMPENAGFRGVLCPPGTLARDLKWDNGSGDFSNFFQTIEGGLGFWGSTQFANTIPKYRMNGTPNCYSSEISSPGWGFGNPTPLDDDRMGLAQLSNRLIVPPDGLTMNANTNGQLLGVAWMALPMMDPRGYFHVAIAQHRTAAHPEIGQ